MIAQGASAMEMSIREFKAKVSAAVAAVERGEAVTITKFGKAVADLVPPRAKVSKLNFEALDAMLKERGLDNIEVNLPDYFDDPAYSRKVLGLDD
jgi:prevent-host-death family protein